MAESEILSCDNVKFISFEMSEIRLTACFWEASLPNIVIVERELVSAVKPANLS